GRVAVPTGLVWEDPSLDQPGDEPPATDARPRVHADAARTDKAGNADLPPAAALDGAAPAELTASASNEPAAVPDSPSSHPPAALLAYARRVADEHHERHQRPITADLLRSRMKVGP